MAKEEIFKMTIDAYCPDHGEKIRNTVKCEMNCSSDMATSVLVDLMKRDEDFLRVASVAVHHVLKEKANGIKEKIRKESKDKNNNDFFPDSDNSLTPL